MTTLQAPFIRCTYLIYSLTSLDTALKPYIELLLLYSIPSPLNNGKPECIFLVQPDRVPSCNLQFSIIHVSFTKLKNPSPHSNSMHPNFNSNQDLITGKYSLIIVSQSLDMHLSETKNYILIFCIELQSGVLPKLFSRELKSKQIAMNFYHFKIIPQICEIEYFHYIVGSKLLQPIGFH